jgi:hypothetical protein
LLVLYSFMFGLMCWGCCSIFYSWASCVGVPVL